MNRTSKTMLSVGLTGIGIAVFAVPSLKSDPLFEGLVGSAPQIQYVPIAPENKVPAVRHRVVARRAAVRVGAPQFGDPLPGLTAEQLAAFDDGLDEFESPETIESGLGPIFNNVSCVSCHFDGGTGGASKIKVTRFGREVNGVYDPLTARGGSLLQMQAIDPAVLEVVPPEANVVIRRQATPLFGLGLIEAIPDATIRRNAQEQAGIVTARGAGGYVRPSSIHGRAAVITDVVSGQPRVGRFGWKAQQATILAFSGDAYLNEMGITNRLFPTENAPNGDTARLAAFDSVAELEDTREHSDGREDIDFAADFMRLLGPPPTLPLTPSAIAGRALFTQIECATCHKPVMRTGASPIAALNNKPVSLYSDLLLHKMGTLGDRIEQADAYGDEFRTPPLWGLRASGPYLHDGHAATVDKAIRYHDGEAKDARDRYLQLTPRQKQQLLDFLGRI